MFLGKLLVLMATRIERARHMAKVTAMAMQMTGKLPSVQRCESGWCCHRKFEFL